MSSLRIGLIGCGRIARLTHIHAIRTASRAELVAVADSDEAARSAAAAGYPGVVEYPTGDALIESGQVDAVLIATPPALHIPLAKQALEAGLHVYIEKPMGCTVDECESLCAAWRSSELIGMMGFNQRSQPLLKKARSWIRAGRIGSPTLVRSVFTSAVRELPEWKQARASGGGVLFDLASHHLDALPWLLDTRVRAVSASIRSHRTEDDNALLTIRLENGLEAQIAVSMTGAEQDRIEIMGDEGTLIVNRYGNTIDIVPARRPRTRAERLRLGIRSLLDTPVRVRSAVRPLTDVSYRLAIERFADAALRGSSVPADFDVGLQNMRVLDAAMRSAEHGARFEDVPAETVGPTGAEERVAERLHANPEHRDSEPALSVIFVGYYGFSSVARGVECLKQQTVRECIELILIGPSLAALERDTAGLNDMFHSIRLIEDRHIENVDIACAAGIRAARAPIVALVEDHAYPDPDWAEAMLAAHEGPWTVVGSGFRNANPASVLSWANILMSYGAWCKPVSTGDIGNVSRHNVSFKRDAALALGNLEQRLGRDGDLLDAFLRNGGRFGLAGNAFVEHSNFSRLIPTLTLRIKAGRLAAAKRVEKGNWPLYRRAAYILGSPLIPFMRSRHLVMKVLSSSPEASRSKRLAGLIVGASLDAFGQVLGFAFGENGIADELAEFEKDRERFLSDADRARLAQVHSAS